VYSVRKNILGIKVVEGGVKLSNCFSVEESTETKNNIVMLVIEKIIYVSPKHRRNSVFAYIRHHCPPELNISKTE